jgi:uncharacterized repeat protein (TIGR01451 family)/CSLREA domain-containing protein
MSRNLLRRALLVIPLVLATLAGCKDTEATAPKFGTEPMLAQGDGGVWTVNSLADPGEGICDDAHCTLREAIGAAGPDDQIVFASGLQGTIALAPISPLVLQLGVSIDGGGRITLDALGAMRVMEVVNPDANVVITVTLTGLTLKNGSATIGGGLRISDHSAVTIRNSVISGNTATDNGGGIFISPNTSVTLINSSVESNNASISGGGIHNSGTLVVTGSTIANNQAANAGGIHNGGSLSLVRSTLSGNEAVGTAPIAHAGGIFTFRELTLVSTTITKNGRFGFVQSGGSSTAANSIIAGNFASCAIVSGSLVSLGNNLADLGGCSFNAAGDLDVSEAVVFSQVVEPDLKDNGGPTRTHALIARGLAVDAGYCPGETTDQRGFARPVDDPTMPNVKDACDIGAYEAHGPQVAVADLMVSQSADKGSVKQGELLTYTVRVQNLGPQTAPNVVLNNVLSSGVTFVEARQNKGSITAPPQGETGTVTWNLGDMANQANEAAEIVVTVLVRGKTTITNTATVSGNVSDPNSANNSAAITVTVVTGKAGKPRG